MAQVEDKRIFYLTYPDGTDIQYVTIMLKAGLIHEVFLFEDSLGNKVAQRYPVPLQNNMIHYGKVTSNDIRRAYYVRKLISDAKNYILKKFEQ